MLQFTKDDFSFLSDFVFFSDTKLHTNNKIKIFNYEGYVVGALISNSGCIVKKIKSIQDTSLKDFSFVYDVNVLHSLIATFNDDDSIIINSENGSIILNNSQAEYNIVKDGIEINCENYLLYYTQSNEENKIHITDISKIAKIFDFAVGDTLESIAVFSDYYVASNRFFVTCAITYTPFSIQENELGCMYLDKKFIKYLLLNSIDAVDVYCVDDVYIYLNDNLLIVMPVLKKGVPNIFADSIKQKYTFPYSITVSKKDLVTAIQRIKSISTSQYNRCYLEIKNSKLFIKSIDESTSYDSITLQAFDKNIIDKSYPVSAMYLYSILQKIDTNNIVMYMSDDVENSICINIQDENKESFYVLMLLEI